MSLQNLEESLNLLKSELARIPPATQQLESSRESVKQAADVLAGLSVQVNSTVAVLGKVGDSIARVDFPSRLDKVDATVSSVNLAIQNVQADMRSLETRLLDRLASEHAKIITKLEQEIRAARRVNIMLSLFLFFSVVGLVAVVVLTRTR